jgi:hypothetical protein
MTTREALRFNKELKPVPQPKRHTTNAQKQAAYRRCRKTDKQDQFDTQYLPPLPSVAGMPGTMRWRRAIQLARQLMDTVQQEMDDYYRSRSDDWQGSERGEEFQERKNAVDNALAELDDLASCF